ncbi:thiamine ABC transporter substrate-binding protein [Jongsikchunia kroppenstedtii]|uniref:thiamine ABC transporter substrate-binding protein n=1 Tax=Jongsikchunia kroppenstedtii TaxID=1121721 RepID=UPI0003A77F59|nr:thiamine ABC transporter substrate-binding protein [Jongsikchunia kroppenstedtii]
MSGVNPSGRLRRLCAGLVAVGLVVTGAVACGSSGSDKDVVVMTHDAFALPDRLLADFTKQTGYTAKIVRNGDAGQLSSVISLTPGRPKGDVVYGIDNTFASRAIDAGALDAYVPAAAAGGAARYAIDGSDQLTAIDRGDVCVDVDNAWFGAHHLAPPTSLADLTQPQYKNLTVTMDPATSSPGMAFLLATIVAYPGTGWQDYWRQLKSNGVQVVSGWEDAYNREFSGGDGKGLRPIVISYASSPAANPATAALPNTCFAQTEYAGVLRGARNADGARKWIDFMLSPQVQAAVPGSMYVYPVQQGIAVPAGWPPEPAAPATMPSAQIDKNRESWQQQWRSVMGR